jgi:nitroreductase
MTKDIIDAIKERRSIREFEERDIPDATIGRLLESAHLAPSAGNLEPWKFVVVKRDDIKEQLTQAAYDQNSLHSAPVCIVVCAEPGRSAAKYGQRGADLYCLQDTAAAAENILLTATGYGLGSCWVGAFDEKAVIDSLGLDSDLRPVVLIPIGYARKEAAEIPRRPVDEVTLVI